MLDSVTLGWVRLGWLRFGRLDNVEGLIKMLTFAAIYFRGLCQIRSKSLQRTHPQILCIPVRIALSVLVFNTSVWNLVQPN
jgi:hypothetical protein